MSVNLLQSQFDALEIPKNTIQVSIKNSPEEIIIYILVQLRIKKSFSKFAKAFFKKFYC